jgi:hypothetical protein
MANAYRDENSVPTLIAGSSADGTTLVRIKVNATNHGIVISDASTGTDHGPANAPRDENMVPALLAVSSADGVTPVVVYANAATGALLVDSH